MDNYPSCLVHLQYSYLADHRGVNPAKSRKEDVLTGVLFDFPRIQRRRIVGIRTSQDISDDPKISSVCGIEAFHASTRKSCFLSVPVELNSLVLAATGQSAGQLCNLFWIDISKDESPGLLDKGRFFASKARTFPDYEKWIPTNNNLKVGEKCVIIDICNKDGSSEVARPIANIVKVYHQGVVLQLPQNVGAKMRFDGSPVFDNSGCLMALGMFTVKLNNGATGLVAMSLDHLAANYGHMIESVL